MGEMREDKCGFDFLAMRHHLLGEQILACHKGQVGVNVSKIE